MVNALKQAVQFGLDKKCHLAGAQQELEPLEGLPPEARIGAWVMEWYWKQPGVPHVAEFVDIVKKRTGRVPTARTWFGFVSDLDLRAGRGQGQIARRGGDGQGPARISSCRRKSPFAEPGFYRAGQNQLSRPSSSATPRRAAMRPDDLFKVTKVVDGADVAGTVEEAAARRAGCKMTWPWNCEATRDPHRRSPLRERAK